ncbi:PREDICTED: uncharacterized protein LOC108561486 isoform X2 [Nicrophorus vespilloides]|uniref:Uncharacterized protein LOC108561486 isoform X2 n=1 Tax=Nicrophorus vespilloides TaxID=110193 RepID=A0ABM1MK33_NICVS|nr:PREDICTED: uncharacterized protein LOC108561486 isoform X2 [Nicrophorus vespilloides]
MWELPNYDSIDIMPGIEPENTQLPVFVRDPPITVKVRRRNMTMAPNDVRLWPKYKRSKYRRERLNVGTETYNENNLQFTQQHAITQNYMNTTNNFLHDSLIMQNLRNSSIRRFNKGIKPLRELKFTRDFLEMMTPKSTMKTTSFPLFFITSNYLRKIKPNPFNEVVLLPRGFTFPTTTDENKPTEFDISDTLNRFLEDVKKLAEEYYLVKRLKDSDENYMKRDEKKANTIVIMARADDESTTTSDTSTTSTTAAVENTTTEVKKNDTTVKDESNEECATIMAEDGANNRTAVNKTMPGGIMEEVKPESTGTGEHNPDDKSCPEGKFFHLSKEALEKVELTTPKNESCGKVHCHSNTYTVYDEKLPTTKLKKSAGIWRNWRHTTYSPLRKSQIRSSRKKKMRVELQDDVEEINLYLRRTRSVESNDNMIKELQEVLKDVESIKTGKTLAEGAIMSDLNIDMTATLRKPILKNQLGFMGKLTWNITFRRPFVSKKNYIILHAIQKKEKLFAIYMGECRVCRQREIIQGQWLVTRHSRDCEGLGATEQLVGDVWRKDKIQEMKRNRLKMLKSDQVAEISPDPFSDETTTSVPPKSSI